VISPGRKKGNLFEIAKKKKTRKKGACGPVAEEKERGEGPFHLIRSDSGVEEVLKGKSRCQIEKAQARGKKGQTTRTKRKRLAATEKSNAANKKKITRPERKEKQALNRPMKKGRVIPIVETSKGVAPPQMWEKEGKKRTHERHLSAEECRVQQGGKRGNMMNKVKRYTREKKGTLFLHQEGKTKHQPSENANYGGEGGFGELCRENFRGGKRESEKKGRRIKKE